MLGGGGRWFRYVHHFGRDVIRNAAWHLLQACSAAAIATDIIYLCCLTAPLKICISSQLLAYVRVWMCVHHVLSFAETLLLLFYCKAYFAYCWFRMEKVLGLLNTLFWVGPSQHRNNLFSGLPWRKVLLVFFLCLPCERYFYNSSTFCIHL